LLYVIKFAVSLKKKTMKNLPLIDLYSDYLLTNFRLSTATGMSKMLDNSYSHDQISRFLAQPTLDQKDYWKAVKPMVRKIEQANGVICIDDFIVPKPHSTTNDMITYHFDHTQGRNVKGFNIISFLYSSPNTTEESIQLPIAYEIVTKPIKFIDEKTKKQKRRSEITKNELMRERLKILTLRNKVKYRYVTWDTWFSSAENFELVEKKLNKYFVAAIKANRKVALSWDEKLQGKFYRIDELEIQPGSRTEVWIKGLSFPVYLIKQIFKNKDGSTGVLYLVSNDKELTYEEQKTIYQIRWKVEVFHKSAKQNASLGKSPTKYEVTQSNHIFCSMIAVCKLELLKIKHRKNHFAIKAQLYIKAVKAAFEELQFLKSVNNIPISQTQRTMPLLA